MMMLILFIEVKTISAKIFREFSFSRPYSSSVVMMVVVVSMHRTLPLFISWFLSFPDDCLNLKGFRILVVCSQHSVGNPSCPLFIARILEFAECFSEQLKIVSNLMIASLAVYFSWAGNDFTLSVEGYYGLSVFVELMLALVVLFYFHFPCISVFNR